MSRQVLDDLPESLKGYSFRFSDDGYYLVKNEDGEHSRDWEKYFELPKPIEWSSPNRNVEKTFYPNSIRIWQDIGAFEHNEFNGNGYIRPYFRFIKSRRALVRESKEDYRRVIEQIDLDKTQMDLINQVSNYRNTLFQQIQRQAIEVWRINKEIAEMLKVFYFETGQAVRSLPNQEWKLISRPDRPLIFYEIRNLFNEAVVGGADTESLQSYWVPEKVESNQFVPDQLNQATAHGLLSLSGKREPILKIAEQLARVILPLETVLENLITGKQFSEIDYVRKEMPDPWRIARAFQKRAKNVVYDTEIVGMAMTETREYILQHDLRSLNRHVEAIKRIISNKISVKPDPKTIRNWINTYGNSVFQEPSSNL